MTQKTNRKPIANLFDIVLQILITLIIGFSVEYVWTTYGIILVITLEYFVDTNGSFVNYYKYHHNYLDIDSIAIDSDINSNIDSNIDSIPKIFHFIWLGSPVSSIPNNMNKTIDKWKYVYPEKYGWKFKLWDDTKSYNLINNNPKYSTYKFTYNNLTWIEKCDILRYIIIYEYGGIYLDLDIQPIINKNKNKLLFNNKFLNKLNILFVETPNIGITNMLIV